MVEVCDEEYGAEALPRKALGQAQQNFHGRKAQPVYVVVHLPILRDGATQHLKVKNNCNLLHGTTAHQLL